MLQRTRWSAYGWARHSGLKAKPRHAFDCMRTANYSARVDRQLKVEALNLQARERGYYQALLSNVWIPTGGLTSSQGKQNDGTSFLIRGGFIRQAHSGVFQMIPRGHAVEEWLRTQLSAHLTSVLGASEVALSSLSSESLWRKSGRIGEKPLADTEHNFLTISDRAQSGYILSPTHEEEMTRLVANDAKSYKDFPIRLFQITRKYRDELRPRHGLLRTKEFIMKDLYTFDISEKFALGTYAAVRSAYRSFFKSIGLPIVEARASSGDMGGNLSHEFHVLSDIGEDTLIICQSCGHAENEEVAGAAEPNCSQCDGSTAKHKSIEVGHTFHLGTRYSEPLGAYVQVPKKAFASSKNQDEAAEVSQSENVPLQMGCHGIGVSRLIGTAATLFADAKGLRWPLGFTKHQSLIIVDDETKAWSGLTSLYLGLNEIRRLEPGSESGQVSLSPLIDDRSRPLAWKLKDADAAGFPIIIVLGKRFVETGQYEVQCRSQPDLSTSSENIIDTVCTVLNGMETSTNSGYSWAESNFARRLQGLLQSYYNPRQLREEAPTKAETTRKTRKTPNSQLENTLISDGATGTATTAPDVLQRKSYTGAWSLKASGSLPTKPSINKKRPLRGSKSSQSLPSQRPKAINRNTAGSEQAKDDDLSREHLLERVQVLEELLASHKVEEDVKAIGRTE